MVKIVILGNTASLKNSKQVFAKADRVIFTASKTYKEWKGPAEAELRSTYARLIGREWKYPLRVDFFFARRDRRKFDYINIAQAPLDLLVEVGILRDDDMTSVIPGEWSHTVDKENPRVELIIHELGTD